MVSLLQLEALEDMVLLIAYMAQQYCMLQVDGVDGVLSILENSIPEQVAQLILVQEAKVAAEGI
jgi:hypothetical protein